MRLWVCRVLSTRARTGQEQARSSCTLLQSQGLSINRSCGTGVVHHQKSSPLINLVPHTSYLLIHILWGLPPGPPRYARIFAKDLPLSSSSLQFNLNFFSSHLFFFKPLYSSSSNRPPVAAASQPLVTLSISLLPPTLSPTVLIHGRSQSSPLPDVPFPSFPSYLFPFLP